MVMENDRAVTRFHRDFVRFGIDMEHFAWLVVLAVV
jgi:hypothetical protein